MSTQRQLDFEAELKERIRKNLADLEVKLKPGSRAKVVCRDCQSLVEVVLTGEITKTSLLGDIFDWMKIETPVIHACMEKGKKVIHTLHVIYRLHASPTNSSKDDRRWKAVKDITKPQGTVMVTMSGIVPLLEEDFRKGNIHAVR